MNEHDEYENEEIEGFEFGNDKSKFQIAYEDIKSIFHSVIDIMIYKIKKSFFFKSIYIGCMIVWAIICWVVILGQVDIQILDGEDESKVIFHLPDLS